MNKKHTIAFRVAPHLLADEVFDPNSPHNRDDCLAFYRHLRDALASLDCRIHTHDVIRAAGEIPDVVLFEDIPRTGVDAALGDWKGKVSLAVILAEAPIIAPSNWNMAAHAQFDCLFTWAPDLLGLPKYEEFRYCAEIAEDFALPRDAVGKHKLCTMIAGNKKRRYPAELYSARRQAIAWFEEHHPADFDLYGVGWDAPAIRGLAKLDRLGMGRLARTLVPHHVPSSWKGSVSNKRAVFARYRFAICYENCADRAGYITEKLFDAFLGGCVPVYWGAPDVETYIPKDCFIDFRQFGNYEGLYRRLTSIGEVEYLGYIDRIETFLRAQSHGRFSVTRLARLVAERLISLTSL